MYTKLMLRGLLRHKKSGRRLFILLALCSLMVMFSLGFRDSFAQRYRELGVDVSTGNLQVVPKDSPKNRSDAFNDHRQGLAFLEYDTAFRTWLGDQDMIDSAMPLIETGGSLFALDGEFTGYSFQLLGVEPALLDRVLPAVRVVEGEKRLAWSGSPAEVPLFRPVPSSMTGENNQGSDRFDRWSFRPAGQAWEGFKLQMVGKYPALFAEAKATAGADGDQSFIDAMNRALDRADLLDIARAPADQQYDYRVDDAQAALEAVQDTPAVTDSQKHSLKVARKRWLQALESKDIRPVWDIVSLDTSYTMTVPPARGDDLIAQPLVIPVRMSAYVQSMPLYFFNFYVDNKVLRDYLAISGQECTSLVIRLKDGRDTAAVKAKIEGWLKSQGLDYVVKDSESLGQIFLSTALAFDVIALIIVVLFVATVVVFIMNTVTLSLIKRRREIGTSIALGLSPFQNAVLMFGEMGVLVLAAWIAGAALGTILELVLAAIGLPGMIFFPGGVLHFLYNPAHAVQTLAIILPVSLASTAFALRKVGSLRAVDLLKEAS